MSQLEDTTGREHALRTTDVSTPTAGALPFIIAVQRELRGPLNALAGVVRELEALDMDRHSASLVDMARTSMRALNLLTSDLITLAAVRNGESAADPISFDLRVAMNNLQGDWTTSEPYSMDLHIAPDVPSRLVGLPTYLRRVLQALGGTLSSPESPAPLALSVMRTGESATRVGLEFQITRLRPAPAEPPDRSFDLLVAECIASGMEGEIARGTDWCELKLTIQKDVVRAPYVRVAPVDLLGRRILLVGPSGPSRVSLQVAVRGLGCHPSVASSVEDAVREMRHAAVGAHPVDMCIADLAGHTEQVEALARAIKDDASLSDLPLIILVEVGSSGDAAWANSLGSAAYLAKPVQADELAEVLTGVFAEGEKPAAAERAPLITRHTLREASAPRLKCLVVDDDRVNLLAVQAMLERMGHYVEIAHDGTEALDKTAHESFDLIVTDVRMPDMDGDQLALVLGARQRDRNEEPPPIVAMTATPNPGDEALCLASGILQYHRKPVTLELLSGILDHVMKRSDEGNEQPAAATAHAALDAEPDAFAAEDVIHWDHLEMACHGVPELKIAMLAAFRTQLQEARERLANCVEENRLEDLAIAAEACGSSCTSIGALPAARTLARLERLAADRAMDEIRPLLAEVLAELDRLEAELPA